MRSSKVLYGIPLLFWFLSLSTLTIVFIHSFIYSFTRKSRKFFKRPFVYQKKKKYRTLTRLPFPSFRKLTPQTDGLIIVDKLSVSS
jgi:hypothetical protein